MYRYCHLLLLQGAKAKYQRANSLRVPRGELFLMAPGVQARAPRHGVKPASSCPGQPLEATVASS